MAGGHASLTGNKDRSDGALQRSPCGHEMGDGDTDYNAIHIDDDDDLDNLKSASENARQSSMSSASVVDNGDGDSNRNIRFEDVESRNTDGFAEKSSSMSRERRLTLMQLERFRKAMAKRSQSARGCNAGDAEFDNLFGDSSLGPCKELRFVTYPWHYWVFGLLVFTATTVFVERVHSTSPDGKLKDDWWKYLVACIVYVIALGIVANGRVETFVISKDSSRLLIRSSKPLCFASARLRRARCVDRDLRHIVDIRVEASGEFSGDVDTRCYKLHFEFDDGVHATALESRCKNRTLERCRLVKDFVLSCATSSSRTIVRGHSSSAEVQIPHKKPALVSVPSSSLPRKNRQNSEPIVPLKLEALN